MELSTSSIEEADSEGRSHPPFRFWSVSGDLLSTLREWEPAYIEVHLDGAGSWDEWRLFSNDNRMPLRQQRIGGRVRTIAKWPRSGPGRYQLILRGPKTRRTHQVEIWPEKMSRGGFHALLEDLQSRLPAQVALTLQEMGGLSGMQLRSPQETTLEEELLRLRRAVEGRTENQPTEDRRPRHLGLAAILENLAETPHQALATEERWVRRGKARRPPGSRLGQALTQSKSFDRGVPEKVIDARTRHTVDVYENRLLRQFSDLVRARLRRLERMLQSAGSEKQAAEASRLIEVMEAARRQASFLNTVSALKRPPTRASMVLQKRPLYRAALESYLDFQKRIHVSLDAPGLQAPLNNLPLLYQLWCTLEVVSVVLEVANKEGYAVSRESFFRRDEGLLRLRLSGGELRLVHPESGVRIIVRPERTYSAGGAGLQSVSYSQRPDLAIEIKAPDGPPHVLLFDPKYKLDEDRSLRDTPSGLPVEMDAGPMKADIDKMHTYRDAIRDGMGRHVVTYAAILYPGATQRFGNGVGAIGAVPASRKYSRLEVRQVVEEALARNRTEEPLDPISAL